MKFLVIQLVIVANIEKGMLLLYHHSWRETIRIQFPTGPSQKHLWVKRRNRVKGCSPRGKIKGNKSAGLAGHVLLKGYTQQGTWYGVKNRLII